MKAIIMSLLFSGLFCISWYITIKSYVKFWEEKVYSKTRNMYNNPMQDFYEYFAVVCCVIAIVCLMIAFLFLWASI